MTTEAVTPQAVSHRSVLQFREKRKFNWLVLALLVLTAIIFLIAAFPEIAF